ncbi:TonB-dependent receptor [Parvularcula dongshanensis]|uniref:Iron complex outermembrane receptor protein n=1 Tax=Parvularcula dongshanensis TaxID=1173995 RepID=A0A840I6T0_9PROT|nr:TonB-dependent receptor [Parvularcula dongshanensis]MBB4660182.1 iron complex outermembrane receptor protein [Parvularcula dongshanensis]
MTLKRHPRRATLMLGAASSTLLLFAPVFAQEDETDEVAQIAIGDDPRLEDEADQDVIFVSGFARSIENSVATKRDANSIVEAVSAEDIGKLPDVSIAESLGRLPGLATQRVEGRAQNLSIRGLGPDFSTALLNGRQQVSTGDNRGVEFDQYPAELLQAAVVYKTPYAGLVGQGLAGTVDLRTLRPLEQSERILSANVRYEFNGTSSLNPDADDTGWRLTGTYADQNTDGTLGWALGVAYQGTPTQNERFNAWGYPDSFITPEGTVTIDSQRQIAGQDTPEDDSDDEFEAFSPYGAIIGGAKPYVQTNNLERIGLIGILQYEPTDGLSSVIDLYYSDFEEDQYLRGIELPLLWGGGPVATATTLEDGFVTQGVYSPVYGVVRNDYNRREAELFSAGWNVGYDFGDTWTIEADLSYSRADRDDFLLESYAGTSYNKGANGTDPGNSLAFEQTGDDFFYFNSLNLDYGDPSRFVLTDPQGWGGGNTDPNTGNPLVQAGFINAPTTEDELTQIEASLTKRIENGFLEEIVAGANYGKREKSRVFEQFFLTPPGGATSAPIPQEALLDKQAGMDYLGIPAQVTYDPLYLVDNFYTQVQVAGSSLNFPQDWTVEEKVLTAWLRADLDLTLGAIPVTGNIGVQMVNTDQTSSGVRIRPGSDDTDAGSTDAQFIPVEDGDSYTDWLPSLNLIFALTEDTQLRFGAARTLARARMDQLNASLSLSLQPQYLGNTLEDGQVYFNANGGNPLLKPYISDGVDLSIEHYFSPGGYVALAGYYKDLKDYVNGSSSFVADFTQFLNEVPDDLVDQLGTTDGIISGPTNEGEGEILGAEFSFAVPFGDFAEPLDGVGLLGSVSYTDSEVTLFEGAPAIQVPGLSEWVGNLTAYFERGGFESRISYRYRDSFLAEVSGISANRLFRTAKSESLIDAQIGYRFESGPLDGFSVSLQALNLTDEPFVTLDGIGADDRQVIDYQSYGRTFLIGASYRF